MKGCENQVFVFIASKNTNVVLWQQKCNFLKVCGMSWEKTWTRWTVLKTHA